MTDRPLKSAVELAMERLRKKDAESGVEPRALSDEQKAAIAEIRSFYEAKIAEQEVLLQSKMRSIFNVEARDLYEREFRRERERLTAERDSKIEKIRSPGSVGM